MNENVKPMKLGASLLYFGIPAAFAILVFYVIVPYFDDQGMHPFYNYLFFGLTMPMIILLAVSWFAYRKEGNAPTWDAFKARYRLGRLTGKAWLWVVGLTLFMIATAGMLQPVAQQLAETPLLAPSERLPEEMRGPPEPPTTGELPTEIYGMSLAGNWWIPLVMLASLVIATLGEEFWWRGYILPRQELAFGVNTWVLHGILWTLFHIYAPWNVLTLLPGALALSYVVQRQQNTTVSILAHGLANGLLVIPVVILGVLG
ncbi:MAG: CPBP family intramembrane metalloprotease [Chloroflexi bacterium]|nr:CPBP family intramembrane metalloprotease [Chloroflexota bacterium]